jgi:hypothetical protein
LSTIALGCQLCSVQRRRQKALVKKFFPFGECCLFWKLSATTAASEETKETDEAGETTPYFIITLYLLSAIFRIQTQKTQDMPKRVL